MPPVSAEMLPMVAHALDLSDGVLAVVGYAAGALTVRQVNGAFARAFAADAAALEGQTLAALADPEEAGKIAALTDAAARGEAFRTDLVFRRPGGGRLWLGLHLMPVPRPAAPATLFVMLARDITAPRHEAERRNAVQRLLASVFAVAEAGLVIVGHDGRFLMTNAFHDRLLGHEPGTLVGRPTLECVAPESRDALRQARVQQAADFRRFSLDLLLLAADGGRVPVTLVSAVVAEQEFERFRVVTVIPRGPAPQIAGPLRVQLNGKIRLISLADVKAALGARWDGMVARVMESAEHIVARQMVQGDSFFRTKDHGFVVCFPTATEDEANFRAAAIAREVRQRLIGAGEDPETVEVSATVAPVPVPPNGEAPAPAVAEQRMAEIEQRLRAEARPPPGAAGFGFERVIGRETGPVLGHLVRALWPPASAQAERAGGSNALPADRAEADLAALRFAAHLAQDRLAAGSEALFLEIDFDCFFSRRKTQALVDLLRGLDAPVRERMVLLMAGLTDSVAPSRVIESVQRVRPACRAVGFVIDTPDLPAAEALVSGGTFVLLNAHAWERTRAVALARIGKLAAGLHARKNALMMRGVESVSGRDALRDCGVSFFVVAGGGG